MTGTAKLRRRLRRTTRGWSFEDLRRLAEEAGIEVLPGRGDHWKFRAPGRPPLIVDPGSGHHEVLPVYVTRLRRLIEEVLDDENREER